MDPQTSTILRTKENSESKEELEKENLEAKEKAETNEIESLEAKLSSYLEINLLSFQVIKFFIICIIPLFFLSIHYLMQSF